MTLPLFLQGRTPAPVRPNPLAVEPASLAALLGDGDPVEWRSERALWPGVAREMLRLRNELHALDRSLPYADVVGQRAIWPFHVDARDGVVTVEWWGDLAAPVRLPALLGDEARELVARYGTDPAGPRQRRAVQRHRLSGWFTSSRPTEMLEAVRALGASPAPAARAALLAARSALPLLPPELGAGALLDRAERRFADPGDGADPASSRDRIRLEGDAGQLDDGRGRIAGLVIGAAIRAAELAEDSPSRNDYAAFTQAAQSLRAAENLVDDWQPFARLLRRLYEFPPLVELALRATP